MDTVAAVLGNGHAAGVQDEGVALTLGVLHMDVAEGESAARGQWGQVVRVEEMAVGGKEGAAVLQHQGGVVRHDGELQHHLVHLGVAVAPHGDDLVLQAVEHGDDLFGGVALGQVVAGAVIEQVAQQQNFVRLFGVDARQQFFTVVGRPVQVGGDEQFHSFSPPGISLYFFTMAFISSKCSSISVTSLNWVRQRTRLWWGYWVLK